MPAEQVKNVVSIDVLKNDLTLRKANELVLSSAKVGKAKKKAAKKEEDGEEKPKRTRKKKTEEPAEE